MGAPRRLRDGDFDVESRAFLGEEAGEINRLLDRFSRLEPGGEQNLVDERIQLGDVARRFPLGGVVGRGLLQPLDGHAEPRQGRTQFVAGMGEEKLVGVHEALDAVGGAVECRREPGDLVLAIDGDARPEIALAKFRDPRLQFFQAARELADQGINPIATASANPSNATGKRRA